MPTTLRFLAFLALLGALAPSALAADSWPQFRGPTGQGIATVQRAPTHWSETENIVWKKPLPGLGWSSPSVQGDQVWVTTALEQDGLLRALCLSLKEGEILHDVEVFQRDRLGSIHQKNSHASPSPVLDGERVYVHYGSHGTACLTNDGKVVWRARLEYNHQHGPGGSPVVYEDLLILNCDGTDVQFVVALDKRTGAEVWRTPRAHISAERRSGEKSAPMAFSTPLLHEVDGAVQLISAGSDHVSGYDPRTGKELWWARYDGYSNVPRPVVSHGLVFVSSGYNQPILHAFRLAGEGDLSERSQAWSLAKAAPHNPSPLAVGEELYVVSDRGVATCLDLRSGEVHWQERLGGNFSASPVLAAGRIYFLDETGVATVIEPGKALKRVATNRLDGRTLASPTPIEGGLLIRTDTHLYRIGEK